VGAVGGALVGQQAHDAASGLSKRMLVGVSDSAVYGFEEHDRSPTRLAFQVERSGLEVKVHQRVNVRVLELIHPDSGSSVELEGLRFPGQHAGDVIDALEP
jgi:hypothetical protein